MAASVVTPGYGAKFNRVGTTPIPEVVGITGPGISREPIDVTHLLSDGMCKEFIAGMIDGGEVSVEVNLLPDDTDQAVMFSDINSTTATESKRECKITLTDPTPQTITCDLVASGWDSNIAQDGALRATVSYKVSGAVSMA